jgi:protein involved in polysaccharide export with SLBB domain
LLVNGDKSHDVELLPGDVVYIPPVGPQVAVYGSVRSPAIYELKDQKETSYRRPLYWSREPKEPEAVARMPNGRTVGSTAKRQLISKRTRARFSEEAPASLELSVNRCHVFMYREGY